MKNSFSEQACNSPKTARGGGESSDAEQNCLGKAYLVDRPAW